MKVTTQHVPDNCDYLTNGVEYEFYPNPGSVLGGGEIRGENHKAYYILTDFDHGCAHLSGKAWEVIKDKEVD